MGMAEYQTVSHRQYGDAERPGRIDRGPIPVADHEVRLERAKPLSVGAKP
jgi:hypothetical protein